MHSVQKYQGHDWLLRNERGKLSAVGHAILSTVFTPGIHWELEVMTGSRCLRHALVRWPRIIPMATEGLSDRRIAEGVALYSSTVGNRRERFLVRNLKKLHDEPRPGGHRFITDEHVARLIRKIIQT